MNDPQEPENRLGKIAALAGVASLLLFFILLDPYAPDLSGVGFILAGIAMISGLTALNREPRKLAIVGMISGSMFVLLFIIATFLLGP